MLRVRMPHEATYSSNFGTFHNLGKKRSGPSGKTGDVERDTLASLSKSVKQSLSLGGKLVRKAERPLEKCKKWLILYSENQKKCKFFSGGKRKRFENCMLV